VAWLTKSRFLSGLQCHKRLWFEIHEPIEESGETGNPVLQGRAFDEVVQRLKPGVVISRAAGMPAAIAETKRVLAKGSRGAALLYQAAFQVGDLAVVADVLRRRGADFDLIEVKATTQLKEGHLPDAAFQALVLQRAKIPVGRVFLGHVNNQFVLKRAGDYDGLLVEVDITQAVGKYLREAAEKAVELQGVMASDVMPAVSVGPHCLSPYECPFLRRCSAEHKTPEYPVDVLPRGGQVVADLLADGYRDLRDVPVDRLTSDLHRRVFDATVSGLAFFDLGATAELRGLPSPFSYLDFETITFAVPEIIGTRPYEQLPFQWSVHVEYSDTDIRHAEFLAIESFGDFEGLSVALIAALPAVGPIFAYNASFEEAVLLRLTELAPAQAVALRGIVERLVDLLPVTRAAYYHRDMRGSWSIKTVMPTIAPELGYEHLEEVQEGDGAQRAFMELRSATVSPERERALRAALLKYCRHDTWVMVVLRRYLCGQAMVGAGGGGGIARP
jgi:Domain of unknown function(DUF2779)